METLKQIIDCFDKKAFLEYLSRQGNPTLLYTILFFITLFVSTAIVFLLLKGIKKRIVKVVWFFLFNYICLLFCITIVFRNSSDRKPIELELFWSYNSILRGERYLLYENIMNVIMFIPIGLILGCLLSLTRWWVALLIGIIISATIELLQLGFCRGLCELDDLIHNTAGCLIGLLMTIVVKRVFNFSNPKIKGCCQVQQ